MWRLRPRLCRRRRQRRIWLAALLPRRERRALGTHALAREAEIPAGAGKTFPRALELFEICRTSGTLSLF